jgi:hypothetical protein
MSASPASPFRCPSIASIGIHNRASAPAIRGWLAIVAALLSSSCGPAAPVSHPGLITIIADSSRASTVTSFVVIREDLARPNGPGVGDTLLETTVGRVPAAVRGSVQAYIKAWPHGSLNPDCTEFYTGDRRRYVVLLAGHCGMETLATDYDADKVVMDHLGKVIAPER